MKMEQAGTLVIGTNLTPQCKDRLTWILTEFAQPGDRVVAVHVLRWSDNSGTALLDSSGDKPTQEVENTFRTLCASKKIKFDVKLVVGASIREGLVDTARSEGARKLILGSSSGLSYSLARYCSKRLRSTCTVMIVNQGKVLYESAGTARNAGSTQSCTPHAIQRGMKRLSGKSCSNPNSVDDTEDFSRCYLWEASSSSDSLPNSPVSVLHPNNDPSFGMKNLLSTRRQSCESVTEQQQVGEISPPGWPLRSISLHKLPSSRILARNLSVVNWALQLPDRPQEESENSNTSSEVEQHPASDSRRDPLCHKLHRLCSSNNRLTTRYSFEEVRKATCNFSQRNLVGIGGCSKVYRGRFSDGQIAAVKCLNIDSPDTHRELLTEIEILTTVQHRHIISLLGCCIDEDNRILVFDFASHGNLDQILHGDEKNMGVMDWPTRRKIAIGIAKALEYLHDGCPRPVIHGDVKSSNILLTANLESLLSDFGLAKWAPTSSSYLTCTDVVGTFGYLAPEYFMFGKLNEKSDVYSFGVVLLELITGRRPIDSSKPKGQENLVIWGRPLLDSVNIKELVDPKLQRCYDMNEMKHMILAAALCVRQSPQFRPRMRRVAKLLSGDEVDMFWARRELTLSKKMDEVDDDYSNSNNNSNNSSSNCDVSDVTTHLALAMIGVDDDVASECSTTIDFSQQSCKSLEDYLGGRFSRSSSFE